jgi:hypothetical protein
VEKSTSRFEELMRERSRLYEPLGAGFESAQSRAEAEWQRLCAEAIESQTSGIEQVKGYSEKGMSRYLKEATADADYSAGLSRFRDLGSTVEVGSEAPLPQTLEGQLTQDILDAILLLSAGQFEETLDVFGPPYSSQGSERQGGDHKQQSATADRTTGVMTLLHNIGQEGGWSYVAAALWVNFMRRTPGSPPGQGNTGIAQVRPFAPFSNRWTSMSFIAPTRNKLGFGVFVQSEDLSGGDRRKEQDHRYLYVNDSTDWYQAHENPNWPSSNFEHALSFNNQAPWFLIRPGRIYSAAVWCWGSCDAHGATIEQASFAAAAVTARMPFCVVAQSKN